ncbi:MAG: hypothetical protein E7256_13775 [Lachnospiraceae bacterium]|nr:hypothetical protein [Lachnospiraceae bacterium]
MDESYQADENKEWETSVENSAAHTTELLRAAAPFFDKGTQQSLHLITQITGLLSTVNNIGRSNISALSLSFHNVDVEGLLRAIRPHCTVNEVSMVDKVLSIFGIKRVYDTYQNLSSSMPLGGGSPNSGLNPDMIMSMAKAFSGDNSGSPFGNMNPEMLQNLFRMMNNGAGNASPNNTSGNNETSAPTQSQTAENNTSANNSYYTNYYNSPSRAENTDASANSGNTYSSPSQNPYGPNSGFQPQNNGYYNTPPNYSSPGGYPSGDYNGYPYYNENPGNDYINPDTWRNYDASNYTVNAASLGPGRTVEAPFSSSVLKAEEEPTNQDQEAMPLSENIKDDEDASLNSDSKQEEAFPSDHDTTEEAESPLSFHTTKNRYMLNSSSYSEEPESDSPLVSAASFQDAPGANASGNMRHAADTRRHNNFSNPFGRRNYANVQNQSVRRSAPSYSPSGTGAANQAKDNIRKPPSPELVNMLTSMLSPKQKETFDSMRKLLDTRPASQKQNP